MSDDIVTRLREHINGDCKMTDEFMFNLAADEIERLRKYIALLSLTVEMQTKELKELKNG